MATVDLNFDTLCGGKAREQLDAALAMVGRNLGDVDLKGKKREITIKIAFEPKGDDFVTMTATTTIKLPGKSASGIAWTNDGVLRTESTVRTGDGQLDLVAHIDEVRAARENPSPTPPPTD